MRRAAFSLLVFALSACEPVVPEGRFACETDDDCPDEMVCRPSRGRCFLTRSDSGPPPEDAGRSSDAGRAIDAGSSDAGADASTSSDASTADASIDAAAPGDASTPDAAAMDASAMDASFDASPGAP